MNRREFLLLLNSAVTAPSALHAQQRAVPVLGFLNGTSPGPAAPFVAAFRQGLRETGYVEGQNLAIGLTASLARPGGNLTGFSIITVELHPKLLELLSELVPRAGVIALLVNPNNPNAEQVMRDVQEAARAKGVRLPILKAGTKDEIDAAFASLVELHAGALFVSADAFFNSRREQLVALAAGHAIPAIYEWREFPAAGGLISYGTSLAAIYREVGIYARRILKGEKPADLPVQQPTTFELVVNLKTAYALGLTVPPSILARADEVIE